jgi:hypothetical protein
MAYATADDVAAELGVTFDAEQQARAEWLIAAAQSFVDEFTGRTWEATDPIEGERHHIYGDTVYLSVVPIASVQAVRIRSRSIGAAETALTAGSGYEVVSLQTGALRIAYGWYGDSDLISDYTPAQVCPADLTDAVAQIVAGRMGGEIAGSGEVPAGVKRYEVGNELRVEMFSPSDVPATALGILNTLKLRRVVGIY